MWRCFMWIDRYVELALQGSKLYLQMAPKLLSVSIFALGGYQALGGPGFSGV